jgi:hypothetical protein
VITLNVPAGGPSHIVGIGGNNSSTTTYAARLYKGRNVIDLPKPVFIQQLQGQDGLGWQNANPNAMKFFAEHGDYQGTPFPDEGSVLPPPTTPAEPAPVVMRKIRAPAGVTNFSHDGVNHEIGKDGTITVPAEVADILTSHGFVAVA